MASGPKKQISILLPMERCSKIRALAVETQRPPSRYIRLVLSRYICFLEQQGGSPDNPWTRL